MEIILCHKCENYAAYRYIWPGENEKFICEQHAHGIKRMADVMGFHLEILPLILEVAVREEKSDEH